MSAVERSPKGSVGLKWKDRHRLRVAAEDRIEAFAERLRRDPAARARLVRLVTFASMAFTAFGFAIIVLMLRREGVV